VAQLSRCYHSTLDDESLSDDILQYVDAAQWQNELLEVEEQAASDPYWSKQDLSPLNSLKLPGQSEVAAQGSFAPQLLTLRLETDLRWRIESIAREQETSLAIFLLACWKVVLWRLSGEAEMTVGVAFDGRNYEDLESNRTPGEVLARHLSLARGEWIQ
jgi:hypothetical protein